MIKSNSFNNLRMRRKSFSWEPLHNATSFPHEISQPIKKNKFKKILNISLKISLHFLTHITLLSLLEPIFFFSYANKIETSIFIDNITSQFKNYPIANPQFFNNLRKNKILYNALIQFLKDNQQPFQNYIQKSNQNALTGFQNKEAINYSINTLAFNMFHIIFAFLIIILFINFIYGNQHYWKILLENISLILLILLYELWFFQNIILHFIPISNQEINLIFLQCSLQNIQNNFPELKYLTKYPIKC